MEDDVTLGKVLAALFEEVFSKVKLSHKAIFKFVCHRQVDFNRYKLGTISKVHLEKKSHV